MHDFSSLITMIYAWPTGFRLQVFRALICRIRLVSLLSYFQSPNPESLSQYIQPQDAHVLGQAELVIIGEAATIPPPLVRNLMGPYLVFMPPLLTTMRERVALYP